MIDAKMLESMHTYSCIPHITDDETGRIDIALLELVNDDTAVKFRWLASSIPRTPGLRRHYRFDTHIAMQPEYHADVIRWLLLPRR